MAKGPDLTPLNRLFTKMPPLGGSVAETERELAQYYVNDRGFLEGIKENVPGLFVFVGPKGAGKSAIQRMIQERHTEFAGRLVSIRPDDMSLWSLVKSQELAGDIYKEIDRRWLNKTLWNYLFVVEVLRREYGDAQTVWAKLIAFFSEDHSRIYRLVQQGIGAKGNTTFSTRFLELIEEVKVGGSIASAGGEATVKLRRPQQKGGTVLNDLAVVVNNLPSLLDRQYLILLDDLDANWSGEPSHIELLEALLSSLQQLVRSGRVSFVVALREDIYRRLSPEDPDKLRQALRPLEWTQRDLKQIIRERIRWATGVDASSAEGFPEIFSSEVGKAHLAALWDVSGENPRRALQTVEAVIHRARSTGQSRADPQTVRNVCEEMSREFLRDLEVVNRELCPGLCFIAQSLRVAGKQFGVDGATSLCVDLLERLEAKAEGHEQAHWVSGHMSAPLTLVKLLLQVDLLRYKPSRESAPRRFNVTDTVDERAWYAVNPAYALGLGLG